MNFREGMRAARKLQQCEPVQKKDELDGEYVDFDGS